MFEKTDDQSEPSKDANAGLVGDRSKLSFVHWLAGTGVELTAIAPGKAAGAANRTKYVSGVGTLCQTYTLKLRASAPAQSPNNASPLAPKS
jgi:hypothetical protein